MHLTHAPTIWFCLFCRSFSESKLASYSSDEIKYLLANKRWKVEDYKQAPPQAPPTSPPPLL